MSRWRDVKKGNIKKEGKRETKVVLPISSLPDRFKAFITDTFLITMPIMYIVFYAIMGSREAFRDNMTLGWVYILLPHFIIITIFLYFKNQTPGYKAYGIKLLSNESKKPAILQIAIRYIIFTISLFLIVPLFYPLFNSDKLGVHDLLSKTLPIYEK